MFVKENIETKTSKGDYIVSFTSEPEGQIQSTIFHDGQTVHIFYKIKSGFSLGIGEKIITDIWISEIFSYLDKNNLSKKFVNLYDEGSF